MEAAVTAFLSCASSRVWTRLLLHHLHLHSGVQVEAVCHAAYVAGKLEKLGLSEEISR